MKKILLFFACMSLLSPITAKENKSHTSANLSLVENIKSLVKLRKSFNQLQQEIDTLRKDPKVNLELDNVLTDNFIFDLAQEINNNTEKAISWFQLGKALLSEEKLTQFNKRCRAQADKISESFVEQFDYANPEEALKLLIKQGANLDFTIIMGPINSEPIAVPRMVVTFFHWAYRASFNNTSRVSNTLLLNKLVTLLIDGGINLELLDEDGYHTHFDLLYFMGASIADFDVIFSAIKNAGGNINLQDKNGLHLLILAVANKGFDLAKLLIKLGSDVNLPLNNGMCALMYAAKNQDLNMVKLLVESGANTSSKNQKNKTAFDYAQTNDLKSYLAPKNLAKA